MKCHTNVLLSISLNELKLKLISSTILVHLYVYPSCLKILQMKSIYIYMYVNPVHRGKTPWKEWQKSSDNEVNKSLYFILMRTNYEIQQHK